MRVLLFLFAVLLCAPLTASPTPLLVMPVDFEVLEMSVGGITDVKPDETEATRQLLDDVLIGHLRNGPEFRVVNMPELSEGERVVLENHVALFTLVSQQAASVLQDSGWRHKRKQFDYTIGPGLTFLAERSGAEKAIFTSGFVADATGGRVVLGVIIASTTRIVMLLGAAHLSSAIVNLRTGEIEWLKISEDFSGHGTRSPKERASAVRLIDRLFHRYPRGGYGPRG